MAPRNTKTQSRLTIKTARPPIHWSISSLASRPRSPETHLPSKSQSHWPSKTEYVARRRLRSPTAVVRVLSCQPLVKRAAFAACRASSVRVQAAHRPTPQVPHRLLESPWSRLCSKPIKQLKTSNQLHKELKPAGAHANDRGHARPPATTRREHGPTPRPPLKSKNPSLRIRASAHSIYIQDIKRS